MSEESKTHITDARRELEAVELVRSLQMSVINCESHRISAELSGFRSGWDCENTQSMFRRCLALARRVSIEDVRPSALETQLTAARADSERMKLDSVRLYNLGYAAGHHDTVEGCYADIHHSDMDSYHIEEVEETLSAHKALNQKENEL